jgi:hypothetical protein
VNQKRVARLLDPGGAVDKLVPLGVDLDEGGAAQAPLNKRLGERVFDVLLERAAQGAGAVGAVGAGLVHNPALGLVV